MAASSRAARPSPCRSPACSSRASKRSLDAKIRQTVRALQLEWALSKDEILGLYLTLAPYGGNLEGIRAASLAYFGKEPRRLTLGEAALLVALPQSPEFRRPDRFPESGEARARPRARPHRRQGTVQRRRDRARQARAGADGAQADAADRPACRRPGAGATPKERVLRLTIDGGLQRTLEKLARERARGARRRHVGRHRRGRQRDRRGAGARRLARLFRRAPRRPGRSHAGGALAGLGAQALHLWPRLRGRADPPRDA